MSKPEFWWCYKWKLNGELLAETATYSKRRLLDNLTMKDAKPVRIRIEEVPEKEGGRR